MKILLLGAKGNLGTQIRKQVSEKHNLISWESDKLDLVNLAKVKGEIIALSPELIINTIAYNAVDKCEEDNAEYEIAKLLNIKLPQYLAEASIVIGSTLVHYSSDYVFGAYSDTEEIEKIKKQGGFAENDIPRVNSKYAKTKYSGEKAILSFGDKNLKYFIIRTSKLFGPIAESKYAKPSFFDLMLSLAQEKKELKVVDDEVSCFTYTPDLAKATLELIENNNEQGLYHIVNEGPSTWYEGLKKILELGDVDCHLIPVDAQAFPRTAKRPSYSVLKNTKTKKLRNYIEAWKEYKAKHN